MTNLTANQISYSTKQIRNRTKSILLTLRPSQPGNAAKHFQLELDIDTYC